VSTPPTLAPLPRYQCYDCQACGVCCRGIFTIHVTPEEIDRITAQGWAADDDFQQQPLFVPDGKKMRLAHREDGACVFLGAEGRCRIHAKFGEPAKPLACRLYPFKPVRAGEHWRIDLRYDCPAVAAGNGRPLTAHKKAILALLPLLPDSTAAPTPRLRKQLPLTWEQAECLTAMALRVLDYRELDLTRRVLGCVYLSTMLRQLGPESLVDSARDKVLDAFCSAAIAAAISDPLDRHAPLAMTRLSFRQLLMLYAREDRRGARPSLLNRYLDFLRMLAGRGQLPPLTATMPPVPFDVLEEPLGIPPDEVVAPLARYLRVRLASQGFFGTAFADFDYLDGFNALLLTYPAIFWFARAFAAGQELPFPDAACIEQAIQLVNHRHGLAADYVFPLERYHLRTLGLPVVLRKLVIWYGR